MEIKDDLNIKMMKGVETITKNNVFGEEDIMNNRSKYHTTAIAKTPCWILCVKQNIFKTEMKETVRRIKEAKAIFLYYSMPYKSRNFNYLKYKGLFMKYFKEEKVKIHEEIVIQGQPSDYLIIIKQGDFEMIKRVQYTVGYYDIQSIKDQEIVFLLTSGSIVGEDGYLYDKVNSYTVKSS